MVLIPSPLGWAGIRRAFGAPIPARNEAVLLLLACLLLFAGCATTRDAEPVVAQDPGTGLIDKLGTLRTQIEADPENPQLYYELGNALYDVGNYNQSVKAYQSAVEIDPDMANAYTNMGQALRRMGESKAAVGAFDLALELNPGDILTLESMLLAAKAAGETDHVLWCAQRLSEEQPDDSKALAQWGALLMQAEHFDEASKVYERLLLKDPGVVSDFYNLGLCHYNLDRFDAAKAAWAKGLELDPADPSTNRALAVLFWANQQYDLAWKQVARCNQYGINLDVDFIRMLQRDSPAGAMTPLPQPLPR